MNRIIKFRAYDKVRKEYLSAGRVFLTINSGKNPADSVQYLDELRDPNLYADRFVIEQFSGLYDKNRKPIYEGDIIHLNDEEFELEHGNGIVEFLDKDCGGRPCGGLWYVEDADEDSSTNTSLYDLYQCGELEIIGNIHDQESKRK